MKLHLKSINNEDWKINEEYYEISTTKEDEWSSLDKNKENNNSQVMNALYGALNEWEYN